jgi:hypothetical protein
MLGIRGIPFDAKNDEVPAGRASFSPATNTLAQARPHSGNDKQLGTIVVSVNDEPFSDEHPEHVKIANAIEIQAADRDPFLLFRTCNELRDILLQLRAGRTLSLPAVSC